METTRRHVLGSVGGLVALSGCLGGSGSNDSDGGESGNEPPTADRSLPEAYTAAELRDAVEDGGPPKDGIPSIDDPTFAAADNAPSNLDGGAPVFGVEMNGETKAYPQYVLVWHEIVNDTVGGEPVSVTYCPLTGTAQGFHRGDTEFGVSGRLINANLVMYDRGTDSWWPQMLARAIKGPMQGSYLEEFRVVWTTWEKWRSAHPDTVVLTEDTGHARDYGRDPYGGYNPPSGYYADDNTLFAPLATDDQFRPKEVVLGSRTADGALAVPKRTLREQTVVGGTLAGLQHVTVYDDALDTGYVYRNPEGRTVTSADGDIAVDGTPHAPGELPLDRQLAFDSMWMAWYGYYPSTEVHDG
jgi:hypothetical protein